MSDMIKIPDVIRRQDAIDAVDSETVSTNPEHFKSSEKFIKFMDDADIASFGKWQWANGFNTALVATTIQLRKLPSVQDEIAKAVAAVIEQPPIIRCENCEHLDGELRNGFYYFEHCSLTGRDRYSYDFCSRAERREE